MSSGRVTLATVARKVGVSRSTVSNAYNRPDQLRDELRREILAAAAELGYAGPDPAARSLRRGRAGAIGIIQHSLHFAVNDPANQLLLGGIGEVCEASGLALVLIPERRPDGDRVDVLATALIDGVIVHCEALDPDRRALVQARQLPLVVLDGAEVEDDCCSVGIDDHGGAALAAEHLLALGHRDIAIVALGRRPYTGDNICEARLAGYLQSLAAAGVVDVPVVDAGSHERLAARAAARELLSGPRRPTAVLAMSDELAAGVVDAARTFGIAVPEELSVVGFDDSPTALTTTPPLTTVHQDHGAKGRVAVEMLLEGATPGRHERLPVELVVRESAAPPSR